MTDCIDLCSLYALQAELDAEIEKNHQVTYESSFERRVLALLVELGEFANETRCFKYWSFKPSSPKEVVLDEYADGMHFLLSLGIALGEKDIVYSPKISSKDLTSAILKVYADAIALKDDYNKEAYEKALFDYLDIIPLLGYSCLDAKDAYLKKMEVNHKRQETKY